MQRSRKYNQGFYCGATSLNLHTITTFFCWNFVNDLIIMAIIVQLKACTDHPEHNMIIWIVELLMHIRIWMLESGVYAQLKSVLNIVGFAVASNYNLSWQFSYKLHNQEFQSACFSVQMHRIHQIWHQIHQIITKYSPNLSPSMPPKITMHFTKTFPLQFNKTLSSDLATANF